MEKLYSCKSLEDLDSTAARILADFPGPALYALYGEMGSGKTTLVKSFCKILGAIDTVTSPTFALINEYQTEKEGPIYHFDVYRIKKAVEVMDIGYETYFFSGHYVFLEWPEKISELLPEEYVYVMLREKEDGSREIHVKS